MKLNGERPKNLSSLSLSRRGLSQLFAREGMLRRQSISSREESREFSVGFAWGLITRAAALGVGNHLRVVLGLC